MNRIQEQTQRIKQWFDAKNALLDFCVNVKHVSILNALYYLKGYTNGTMRIDDALLAINEVKRTGFKFTD